MQLYGIRIFVDDLAAARPFYADILCLPIIWEFEGTAIGYDAGAQIIVEAVPPDAEAEDRILVGRFAGCSLTTENIESACSDLAAKGVEFTGPPAKQAWGGTLAHFKDPSGNVLTLLGQ